MKTDCWQETAKPSGGTANKQQTVPEELMASLLADYKKPEDLIGEYSLPRKLTRLLVEKALDAAHPIVYFQCIQVKVSTGDTQSHLHPHATESVQRPWLMSER